MTATLRGIRIGLIASLALNAFLIALAATLWLGRDAGHRGERPGLMPSPRRLLAQVDAADRPRLEKILYAHRAEMRADIGGIMAARAALVDALKATPYDRDAAASAFETLRERAGTVTKRAQDSVLALADAVDDAQRARIADVIASEHREWRERARHRRGHDRDRDRDRDERRERAPRDAPAAGGEPPRDAPATAPDAAPDLPTPSTPRAVTPASADRGDTADEDADAKKARAAALGEGKD